MATPQSIKNLRPFGVSENIASDAKMACAFRPELRFSIIEDLVETHWKDHLDRYPSCAPVFLLHVSWNNIEQAGIYSIAVGNGDDGLTSFTDDGLLDCPEPHWPEEAAISEGFVSDFLKQAFLTNISAYTDLMDSWKEQMDCWVGSHYVGQTAFFIPLRDPHLVFVKEDQHDAFPALVITDLEPSNHNLLKAQHRASQMPTGLMGWCPKSAVSDGQVSLFLAE